jgi:hypothetical protein
VVDEGAQGGACQRSMNGRLVIGSGSPGGALPAIITTGTFSACAIWSAHSTPSVNMPMLPASAHVLAGRLKGDRSELNVEV